MIALGVIARPVGVALVTLGLSGCLGGPDPATGKTESPAASGGSATEMAIAPEKKDTKFLALIPKRLPEKVYPPPSRLSGMNRFQIIGLLGEPGFQRRDDPALIWQYRTETCALDVFLYQSGNGAQYRVEHFEARTREKGTVTAKDCFIALLKAHEQRPTG
jgi:hypothetical protein